MKMTGNVEKVVLLEHIVDGLDYLEVTIEFDTIKWFYNYIEALEFVGKRVEYTIRMDYYHNEPVAVIANIATFNVVQTITAPEMAKLIPQKDTRTAVCNFDIFSLRVGEREYGRIAFLAGYEAGVSKKAKWMDCRMVDMYSKVFILRIFTPQTEGSETPEEAIESLVGYYVKFDVECTKYGFQTQEIELYNVSVIAPPEVDIALNQIEAAIMSDEELQEYVDNYNFLNYLKSTIYYELGYHLVYIAAEIMVIKAVCAISDEYDEKELIRAAVSSRGYLLPSKSKFSRPLLNVNKVLKTSLAKDHGLVLILDVLSEESITPTKAVYLEITAFVKKILDEKRGEEHEESFGGNAMLVLHSRFGGLL